MGFKARIFFFLSFLLTPTFLDHTEHIAKRIQHVEKNMFKKKVYPAEGIDKHILRRGRLECFPCTIPAISDLFFRSTWWLHWTREHTWINQMSQNESCWGNNESTNTMRLQLRSHSGALERIVGCDAGVFPQQPSFCSQAEKRLSRFLKGKLSPPDYFQRSQTRRKS